MMAALSTEKTDMDKLVFDQKAIYNPGTLDSSEIEIMENLLRAATAEPKNGSIMQKLHELYKKKRTELMAENPHQPAGT